MGWVRGSKGVVKWIHTRMFFLEKRKENHLRVHPPSQCIPVPNLPQTAKISSNYVFPMYSTICPWILHFWNKGPDRYSTLLRFHGWHFVVGMKTIWWYGVIPSCTRRGGVEVGQRVRYDVCVYAEYLWRKGVMRDIWTWVGGDVPTLIPVQIKYLVHRFELEIRPYSRIYLQWS